MKKTPLRYSKKRLKRLEFNLKSFGKTEDPEQLHQARVEIKRIKAVLGLIQFNDKKFNAHKAYIPFRDIFRACLTIREKTVMQGIDQELSRTTQIRKNINRTTIDSFKKKIPAFTKVVEREGKLLLKRISKVDRKVMMPYLKMKKEELRNKLYPSFHSKDLHKTRKLVKEIIFLEAMMLPKEKRDFFYIEVAELIGEWHDRVVYRNRLKKENLRPPVKKINTIKLQNRVALRQLRKLVKDQYESI